MVRHMTDAMNLAESVTEKDLLTIDQASVMQADRLVLDALSLRIAEGQHTAILGPMVRASPRW